MACEDFKKTKSPVKMATKAKKIYEDFIQAGGDKEVGIVHSSCFSSRFTLTEGEVVVFMVTSERPTRGALWEKKKHLSSISAIKKSPL